MEREYGVSLLATFEPIRTRRVIEQASGLRHTRAPPERARRDARRGQA
jgi:hypothetical protein